MSGGEIDLGQELMQKALSAVEDLIHDHQHHRISSESLRVGLQSIWSTAAGLLGKEFVEVIESAQSYLDEHGDMDWRARVFVRQDEAAFIRWNIEHRCLSIKAGLDQNTFKTDRTVFAEDGEELAGKIDKLAAGLISRGYQEV